MPLAISLQYGDKHLSVAFWELRFSFPTQPSTWKVPHTASRGSSTSLAASVTSHVCQDSLSCPCRWRSSASEDTHFLPLHVLVDVAQALSNHW